MQFLRMFANSLAKKFPLMRTLKYNFEIACKSFSSTTDLQTLTQTLCLKGAHICHIRHICQFEKFLCLLILKSSENLLFANIYFLKSDKNILFAFIEFCALSKSIHLARI